MPDKEQSPSVRDHERIWLQPKCCAGEYEGRLWCQDKVWPDGDCEAEPTEYVRADLHAARIEALHAEREKLRAELSAAKGYLMNAKIDLETGAPKATALRTIEGGIARVSAALNASPKDSPDAP